MSPRKMLPFLTMLPRLEAYAALAQVNVLTVALGHWTKGNSHERRKIIRNWERLAGIRDIRDIRESRQKQTVEEHLTNMGALGFRIIRGSGEGS